MRHILLDNAYESWKSAIEHHDRIQQGYSSFQHQKAFVSSLHNAVELFLKQRMLDINSKDVASVRKKCTSSLKDELENKYKLASELNLFFESLSEDELNAFQSIEFSKLIGRHETLLGLCKFSFKTELELLQRLRNSETHFYINKNNYLTEKEFVLLHNFMIEFYNTALENSLFPCAYINFENMERSLIDEESILCFDRTRLNSFSYIDALKKCELFDIVIDILKGENEPEYAYNGTSNWGLAKCIVKNNPQLYSSFFDIFTIIQLMSYYKLFEILHDEETIELEDGKLYNNIRLFIEFHI